MLVFLRLLAASATGCTTVDSVKYCTDLPETTGSGSELKEILQIALGVAAALAVLFVVIGGMRFVTSSGDPQGAAKARNTMIYAIVGLLVSVMAEAIVAFAIKGI